jgi:hypothetical protein
MLVLVFCLYVYDYGHVIASICGYSTNLTQVILCLKYMRHILLLQMQVHVDTHIDQLNDQITCVNRGGRGICMSGCPKECAYGLARYSLQMCICDGKGPCGIRRPLMRPLRPKALEREKEKGCWYLCFDSPTTKSERGLLG